MIISSPKTVLFAHSSSSLYRWKSDLNSVGTTSSEMSFHASPSPCLETFVKEENTADDFHCIVRCFCVKFFV